VGIVAVLLIVFTLSLIGGVITSLVAIGAVAKTNDLVSEQAFGLVTAGFEYALKRIDDGFNPDGDVKTLGNGQFTVGYDNDTGVITVTSDVSAMHGQANPQYTVQGPTGGAMADCLNVIVSGAAWQNAWWHDEMRGIDLQNTCNADITITAMTVSWTSPAGQETVRIRLGNNNVYNQWPGTPSGVPIDITDWTLSSCTTRDLTYIRFNTDMGDRNFTIQFTMSDGSTKQAFVQFVANNEADCLNVDLSGAYVGGSGYTRLIGGTLANSCAPPTVIGISGLTVSWTPLSPARVMNDAVIDGSYMWSGSAASGVQVSFWNNVSIDGNDSVPQDFFAFNYDMRGRNYTIEYHLKDGTSLLVPLNVYEADMAACLGVDNSGVNLASGNRNLQGQLWQNTCPLAIVVDLVLTNWSGVPASRRLQQIRVNGSNVWSGSASSGNNLDITDIEVSGTSTVPVNRYRFNNNMSGGCFNHVITMFDGGTVSVPSYCP
jgi:hypothetical protein